MEYNFSNVLLILHVKYFFTIGYDLKLLLTKVIRGPLFRTQCIYIYMCVLL